MKYPKPSNFTPETHFSDDHPNKPGKPRCQSWNKNQGRQCGASPVTGKNVCRVHGGATPSGMASANTTHGLYSKDLPARLSGQYEDLLNLGPEMFAILDETAVMTLLIKEQLTRIEQGESSAAWNRLKAIHTSMQTIAEKPQRSPNDIAEYNAFFEQMGNIINYGSMRDAARNETVNLVDHKRKLVADERKNWAARHQAITFDRVALILTAIATAFRKSLERHIIDDDSRKAVLTEAQEFLNHVISP